MWFESFARRKLGADIVVNRCISLELAWVLRSSRYAATLLIAASNAGYIASSLPWLVVMSIWMDSLRSVRIE